MKTHAPGNPDPRMSICGAYVWKGDADERRSNEPTCHSCRVSLGIKARRSFEARPGRPLPDILADAWRLRDELDAAAVRAAHAKIEAHPEGVREALEVATSALYLKERHKWEGKFWAIIRALDPDLHRILEERGEQAAYDAVHGEEEPAP